jgi:hypothetical protein
VAKQACVLQDASTLPAFHRAAIVNLIAPLAAAQRDALSAYVPRLIAFLMKRVAVRLVFVCCARL